VSEYQADAVRAAQQLQIVAQVIGHPRREAVAHEGAQRTSGSEPAINPQDGFYAISGNRTKPHRGELITRQARPLACLDGLR